MVILCCPEWMIELKDIAKEYSFEIYQWEDGLATEIIHGSSHANIIILAFKEGENEILDRVKPLMQNFNEKATVLRLLRDLFIRISLQLGGPYTPQDQWRSCDARSPSYFIFAIPRTGSTFLGDIFEKSSILGFPKEHLLIHLLPVFFRTDLTFNEWIRALIRFSFSPNGCSGTKLISHLFLEIFDNYGDQPGLQKDLMDLIGKYPAIFLKRRNKIRQAISIILARKSSVWHSKKGHKIMSSRRNENDQVFHQEMEETLLWLHEQEECMCEFFKMAGIAPKIFYYEDFSDDNKSREVFNYVCDALHLEPSGYSKRSTYDKLSDERNEAYLKQYIDFLLYSFKNSEGPQKPLSDILLISLLEEVSRPSRDSSSFHLQTFFRKSILNKRKIK